MPLTWSNGPATDSSAVEPALFLAFLSAPFCSRSRTMSVRQRKAAQCSAVEPSLFLIFRSAPAFMSARATSVWSKAAAVMSGVAPVAGSFSFRIEPALMCWRMAWRLPCLAASWRLTLGGFGLPQPMRRASSSIGVSSFVISAFVCCVGHGSVSERFGAGRTRLVANLSGAKSWRHDGAGLEGLPPSKQQDFTLALRNLPLTLRASGRIAFGIFCTSVVNLLRFIVPVKSVATAEAEMNASCRATAFQAMDRSNDIWAKPARLATHSPGAACLLTGRVLRSVQPR